MALISPILDDRSYEQLREELRPPDPGLHPGVDRPQRERSRASRCWSCSPTSASRCSTGSTRSRTPRRSSSSGCSASRPRPAQPAHGALAATTELAGRRAGRSRAPRSRPATVPFETERRDLRLAARRRRGRQGARPAGAAVDGMPDRPGRAGRRADALARLGPDPASSRPRSTSRPGWPPTRPARTRRRSTSRPASTTRCGSRCCARRRPTSRSCAARACSSASPSTRRSPGPFDLQPLGPTRARRPSAATG